MELLVESDLDKCLRLYDGDPEIAILTAISIGILEEFVLKALDCNFKRYVIVPKEKQLGMPSYQRLANDKLVSYSIEFRFKHKKPYYHYFEIYHHQNRSNLDEWYIIYQIPNKLFEQQSGPKEYTKEEIIAIAFSCIINHIKQTYNI